MGAEIVECENEREIITSFNKSSPVELTDDECEMLMHHTINCEICKQEMEKIRKNSESYPVLAILAAQSNIEFAWKLFIAARFDPPIKLSKLFKK